MASKADERRTENQRKVFDFLVDHFKSGKPFTKEEIKAETDWQWSTFRTYWSKQFKQFVTPIGGNSFRISEAFQPFATWEAFRQYIVTQVRKDL